MNQILNPIKMTYDLIERLEKHRVFATEKNRLSASIQESWHRFLPYRESFIEEIFRVGPIMIDEENEKLLQWIVYESSEQPLVEVSEIDKTARLEAFNVEAFDFVVEDCRVLIVKQSNEI